MIYEVILYSFYIFRGGSTSIHAPDSILFGQTWCEEDIYGQGSRWDQENTADVSRDIESDEELIVAALYFWCSLVYSGTYFRLKLYNQHLPNLYLSIFSVLKGGCTRFEVEHI